MRTGRFDQTRARKGFVKGNTKSVQRCMHSKVEACVRKRKVTYVYKDFESDYIQQIIWRTRQRKGGQELGQERHPEYSLSSLHHVDPNNSDHVVRCGEVGLIWRTIR